MPLTTITQKGSTIDPSPGPSSEPAPRTLATVAVAVAAGHPTVPVPVTAVAVLPVYPPGVHLGGRLWLLTGGRRVGLHFGPGLAGGDGRCLPKPLRLGVTRVRLRGMLPQLSHFKDGKEEEEEEEDGLQSLGMGAESITW